MEVIAQQNNTYLRKEHKEAKQEESPFIESNTTSITITDLKENCIIPVFSKDNERTISHHEFIQTVLTAISEVFPNQKILAPEIRVSHQIKGRAPEAIHKSVKELLDNEKTMYFERMAFIIKLPDITFTVAGNELALSIGGVRAYNKENLYSKKSSEKFKIFVGFQNKVCCNLCVSTDGCLEEVKVSSIYELKQSVTNLLLSFNPQQQIETLQQYVGYSLTEAEFTKLVGRIKMYQFLPNGDKKHLFKLELTESHLSTIVKNYYQDENFAREFDGSINFWKLYNLCTEANKSSYIDTYLARHSNISEFINSLIQSINGGSDHWFLS
ncbi:DUF3871 family protein [Wenyingzhuangia sp. IMCC45533]